MANHVLKLAGKILNPIIPRYEKLKGKIVWTNPNPTSVITTKDIQIDFTNFDAYEILYKVTSASNRMISSGIVPVGWGTNLPINDNHYREVTSITGGLRFENANNETRYSIPVYVVAYRLGIFDD